MQQKLGLQAEADKFFIFVAALIVVSTAAQSLGMFISSGASEVGIAMAIGPAVFIPIMLLGT